MRLPQQQGVVLKESRSPLAVMKYSLYLLIFRWHITAPNKQALSVGILRDYCKFRGHTGFAASHLARNSRNMEGLPGDWGWGAEAVVSRLFSDRG